MTMNTSKGFNIAIVWSTYKILWNGAASR